MHEVFFAFDSARVPEGNTLPLAKVALWAHQHPMARIVLDGNADDIGTHPYNAVLALRRAESVQRKLVAYGVDPDRVVLVTYGENAVRRATHALDRRVTIWTTEEPLYTILDRSLERGIAALWRNPVVAAEIDGPHAAQVATR